MTTMEILARAKAACAGAADLKAGKINEALEKMADRLIAHTPGILTANEARASLQYPALEGGDVLTQRGGTGSLGDAPANEGGRGKEE